MEDMNDALHYLFALATGFALGLGFFGGLWWTVQRVSRGNGAVWLVPLSSLVRTVLLLAGFWWVSSGEFVRLALCLAGWLTARQLMIRRCGPAATKGDTACT
jgi:F1F0 ATPase subunit 2